MYPALCFVSHFAFQNLKTHCTFTFWIEFLDKMNRTGGYWHSQCCSKLMLVKFINVKIQSALSSKCIQMFWMGSKCFNKVSIRIETLLYHILLRVKSDKSKLVKKYSKYSKSIYDKNACWNWNLLYQNNYKIPTVFIPSWILVKDSCSWVPNATAHFKT